MASENEESLLPGGILKSGINRSKNASAWSIGEESGYSSDTSSASTRSLKILELRHSSSDEAFSSLLTPELRWKSRLRISSTPYSSSDVKQIKTPLIDPIINPLLKNQKVITSICPVYASEYNVASTNVSSSLSPQQLNKVNNDESPKCVKQRFKEIGRKSLFKFRSPLKSPSEHKLKVDKCEITNTNVQKDSKDKSVKRLFNDIPCIGDCVKSSLQNSKKYASSDVGGIDLEKNSERLSIQNDSGFEDGNHSHSQLVEDSAQFRAVEKNCMILKSTDDKFKHRLKQNKSSCDGGDNIQHGHREIQTHSSITEKTLIKLNSEDQLNEKIVNREMRERAVKQLFIDKIDSPPRRVSPLLSNIILKIINESPYMLPKIFSYLSSEELVNVSQVNRCFRQVILKTNSLNMRIELFFEDIRIRREKFGKENIKCKEIACSTHYAISSPRKLLQQLQNTTESPKKAQVASSLSLFDKFVREGKKLVPGEIQMKCVQCHNPARVLQSEYKAFCSNKTCGIIFCTRCSMPSHEKSSDCLSLKPRPKVTMATKILTKACKKRLRRL